MLKQDVIKTINTLPDDVTIADVMYRLYVLDKHNKALADIDAGRVHSAAEVRESIVKYQ
jgi:hypothetical protein